MLGPLLVLGGFVVLSIGLSKLRPAYHVYRGETDDVVAVERAEGPVELAGTVSPIDDPLRAPLTGTAALAYEYEVEELQSSGKSSSWNTVDEGRAATPFRLEDATASVRVEPAGAELALSTDTTIEVDGGEPEPEPIREFLAHESDLESENTSLDLKVVELATGNDRRYHERRLEPGGEAYVFGQSSYDVDARETMRDVSAVVSDGDGTPAFVVSDSSQDGTARLLATRQLPWLVGGLLMIGIGSWLVASSALF
ncbi:GIDE domain-containing protein [Natronococcus occultus]|uniref:RING-type E3 ubiquitin transferase n=1 Tax=Natronococcus occultus SP4 TaxID=694430 RepID=L0JVU2_9EURY|nr:GIDE domain-containing protein [Natronococcus occultus]AGB36234.1 E3 Ubiquitin ligase [Natronococcus occultus SP4]